MQSVLYLYLCPNIANSDFSKMYELCKIKFIQMEMGHNPIMKLSC